MKLEIKHIAAYLPYEIKGQYYLSQVLENILPKRDELRIKTLRAKSCEFFLTYCKPILRPLSDINTIINWDDGEYMMTDISFEDFSLSSCEYDTLVLYCSHHFDVFGLIESGLAIDINTINP